MKKTKANQHCGGAKAGVGDYRGRAVPPAEGFSVGRKVAASRRISWSRGGERFPGGDTTPGQA